MAKPELIFAMDGEWPSMVNIAHKLYSELEVNWFKIGPAKIDKLAGLFHMRERLPKIKIFLDLKLADTEYACMIAVRRYRELEIAAVSTFTDAATEGAFRAQGIRVVSDPCLVWRVARLTDEDPLDLEKRLVVWGHGIICPGIELHSFSLTARDGHRIVPGIRRAGRDKVDNHKSPTTPGQAVACGATHLVVGRPIYEAADPVAEARDILREMAEASEQ